MRKSRRFAGAGDDREVLLAVVLAHAAPRRDGIGGGGDFIGPGAADPLVSDFDGGLLGGGSDGGDGFAGGSADVLGVEGIAAGGGVEEGAAEAVGVGGDQIVDDALGDRGDVLIDDLVADGFLSAGLEAALKVLGDPAELVGGEDHEGFAGAELLDDLIASLADGAGPGVCGKGLSEAGEVANVGDEAGADGADVAGVFAAVLIVEIDEGAEFGAGGGGGGEFAAARGCFRRRLCHRADRREGSRGGRRCWACPGG